MQVYNTFNSVVFYASNMVSCLFQIKSFDHCKRKLAPPIQDSNPLLVELEPSAVITRSIDTHRVGGRGGKSGIKQDPRWKIFKKPKNKNEVNTHRLYFPLNFFLQNHETQTKILEKHSTSPVCIYDQAIHFLSKS